MPEQEKELQEALSQITYKGTPYEDCSWELVGEFHNQNSFEPSSFAVLDGRTMIADPMFADYGGVPPAGDRPSDAMPLSIPLAVSDSLIALFNFIWMSRGNPFGATSPCQLVTE